MYGSMYGSQSVVPLKGSRLGFFLYLTIEIESSAVSTSCKPMSTCWTLDIYMQSENE